MTELLTVGMLAVFPSVRGDKSRIAAVGGRRSWWCGRSLLSCVPEMQHCQVLSQQIPAAAPLGINSEGTREGGGCSSFFHV